VGGRKIDYAENGKSALVCNRNLWNIHRDRYFNRDNRGDTKENYILVTEALMLNRLFRAAGDVGSTEATGIKIMRKEKRE
jgi:hypothetical protein